MRCLGLDSRLGCASRQSLWSLRAKNGIAPIDRLVEQVVTRPPQRRTARLLDRRQLFCASRIQSSPTLARSGSAVDAGPRTCLSQLVETGRNPKFSIVPLKVLSPNEFSAWQRWQNDCLIFSATGNQRLSRLNGNSLARILPNCSQNSKISRRHSQEIRDRINETMYEGPYHPSSPIKETPNLKPRGTGIMTQSYRDTI